MASSTLVDEEAYGLRRVLPEGRRIRLSGRGTTFVREVAGPPGAPALVLLHGLSATGGLNWLPAFVPLGQRFRVLAVDVRGHGRGIRSALPFRLEDCADDVVALADELSIERVVPVGYSMGGSIAQLVWRRHPDRVAGLVLCATGWRFSTGNPWEQWLGSLVAVGLRLAPAFVRQQAMRALLRVDEQDPFLQRWAMSEVSRCDPAAVVEAALALARFDSGGWIDQLDAPAAVLVTGQDTLVPPDAQLQLARACGATVQVIDGGHDAVTSRPSLFTPTLVEACDSVAGRARANGVA